MENSNEFDNWLNEVVFDLDHFRSAEQAKTKGQARAISKSWWDRHDQRPVSAYGSQYDESPDFHEDNDISMSSNGKTASWGF